MARSTIVAFYGISHPHSSARFRSVTQLPGVAIKGAYDDDRATLAAFCEQVGAVPLTEAEILEDAQVGAVFVHSKSRSMSDFACRAIRAGKHVLAEKPGGAHLRHLRELAEAANTSKAVVRVGYNFHFSPALERARELLRNQSIGRPSLVRGHGACSMAEHLSAHLNQPDDMGGGLWVIGVHVLHLMVDLFGPPKAVRATVEKFDAWSSNRSREDVASLTMIYEDKLATFDFTVHENCEWFESSEVSVYGDAGQFTFGVLPGRIDALILEPKDGPAGWVRWNEGFFATPWSGHKSLYSELPQVGNKYFFDREVEEFLAAARGETTAGGATAQTAFEVAAVVAASLESAAKGGTSVPVATR